MKTNKLFAMFLAAVMVLVLVTGCGKNNNNAANNAGNNTGNESQESPEQNTNTAGTAEEQPKELSGNLVIWTFFDQVKDMGAEFMKKNPKVKVDVQMFPGDQYQTKLLSAMQTGQNVPDIFDLERGYIGKFINADFITDLSAMGGEDLVKDYIPYVQELGRSSDGKLKAISDHSSPGGFFYIRDVAKQYLGTDDPEEISKLVDSWDKIIDLGKQVYEKSGGKVHLMENAADLFDIEAYNVEPFTSENKLIIDPKWKDIYETQLKIRANNVDAKLGFMSAGWGNALNNGDVILTSMPAWAVFMIDNKDDKAAGKFGVARTPDGFYVGGTYRGIYDKSPNKELAYEFIKFIAGTEWQQHNLEKTGNMPGNGLVYEQNLDNYKSNLTGDQNVMKYFYDLVKDVPALKADKYSEEALSKWRKVASQGITNNTSYDDVVKDFKKEIKSAFPEIQVD